MRTQRLNNLIRKRESRLRKALWLPAASLSFSKEVVGTHALLTRSLFGADILRRLLLRVSLAKLTSAPLRFLWLRRRKPRFQSRLHLRLRETHRGAGAFRHTTSALLIFRRKLPLPLLPQELPIRMDFRSGFRKEKVLKVGQLNDRKWTTFTRSLILLILVEQKNHCHKST
jgi:hypothetical protein